MSRLAVPVNASRDHIRGRPNAQVMLVEYGDYECPACGAAHPVVRNLLRQGRDRIALAFRHFPLSTVHALAQGAAEAAEAAGAQGSFWEMHDVLFENQDALDFDSLLEYADALRLDVARFADDLVSRRHADRVREDFMTGVRSGVNGTPTFFINGERHDAGFIALGDALGAALSKAPSRKEIFR